MVNEMTSMRRLVQMCRKSNLVALLSRDNEENTACAVRLCKYMYEVGYGKILYFSLKDSIENFERKYPELPVKIDDTEGIDINRLEVKVCKHMLKDTLGMVVIDELVLISNYSIRTKRKEEIEYIVSRLKDLSQDIDVLILVLIPISKYIPKDYPEIEELSQYGNIKELFDLIIYANHSQYDCPFQVLKDKGSCMKNG